MYSINQATIVGNVTADPEIKYSPNGKAVLNITLATNHSYKKDEEWVDVPSFHRIVMWGNVAEFIAKSIKKGDKLYVDGRIDYRTYQDKEGQTRYITEIKADRVVSMNKGQGGKPADQESQEPHETTIDEFPDKEDAPKDESVSPDDIPF